MITKTLLISLLGLTTSVYAQTSQPTTAPTAAPVNILAATYIGSTSNDTLDGVAFDAQGQFYVVGNFGAKLELDKITSITVGTTDPASSYGHAYLLRWDATGTRINAALRIAQGNVKLTSVAVGKDAFYIAGYATPATSVWITPLAGLFPKPVTPVPPAQERFTAKDHYSEPNFAPGTDQRGTPFVAQVNKEMTKVIAATYLEGWQSLWHVPQPLNEDVWQPVGLAVLTSGDVVVGHDGGYQTTPPAGRKAGPEEFFHQPDHLSRLSADLKLRRWTQTIYTPPVPAANAGIILGQPWPFATLGNTRMLRLRVDARDNIYACGWSPTQTMKEPWWSPWLHRYDANGKLVWTAYEFDPTSGGGRLNGLVSDSAIMSVALDPDGQVLITSGGDGGNSVLSKDPRDYNKPASLRGGVWGFRGRTLFWGTVARLDATSRGLQGGEHIAGFNQSQLSPAWGTDIVGLPHGQVLAVGRNQSGFDTSKDAWYSGPGAWLRLYKPNFETRFATSIPQTNFVMAERYQDRVVVIGMSGQNQLPRKRDRVVQTEMPPLVRPVQNKLSGTTDGYLMLLKINIPQ
ncbi:MAG: hypothetical protein WCJ97_04985 [Phycisphaerae bacterium]